MKKTKVYEILDDKKYSESFKDVNVDDSLYFLVFNYSDSKNEKAFSTFDELTNLFNSIDSSNEYDVPDFTITEFKVKGKKYPGHSVRHYNYMKMCGDRPNGVGTTTAMVPDEYKVDFVLEDNSKLTTGITYYDSVGYSNIKYVFVKEETLKDFLKGFYEHNIEDFVKDRDSLNKSIDKCKKYLNKI